MSTTASLRSRRKATAEMRARGDNESNELGGEKGNKTATHGDIGGGLGDLPATVDD